MNDTTTTTAVELDRITKRTAAELVTLELLQATWSSWDAATICATHSDEERIIELHDLISQDRTGHADALNALLEDLGGADVLLANALDPVSAWAFDLLELTGTWVGVRHADAELEGVRGLITYGGPNVYIHTDGSGLVEVRATWGGEAARHTATTPRVAERLEELVSWA